MFTRLFIKIAILPLAILTSGVLVAVFPPANANALSGSDFKAGQIIDDAVFNNSSAMTIAQIQTFLNAKVPWCDTNGDTLIYDSAYGDTVTRKVYSQRRGVSTPFICLKDYKQTIPAVINSGSDLCTGSISAGTKSSSQIIYDVSKACGINPQVLIVMLQKEQSLVTDNWPWPRQYQIAMGYGCPDTAPCDEEYYGFFNQVYQAAQAFRRYEANPKNYNYEKLRNNFIYYNPNLSACSGSTVYIQNQATAGLYIYTPYQPNAAALNNLYGLGDSCSAYGNRNFWRLFNDWFGSTYAARVIVVPYDTTTDSTGESARIGFKLSVKPTTNVSITYQTSSPDISKIIGTQTLVFTPTNWDLPDHHVLTVVGVANSEFSGALRYWITPSKPISTDPRYSVLSAEYVGSVSLLHLDLKNPKSVYRLSSSAGQYFYTANTAELDARVSEGWNNEGVKFYYCQSGNQNIMRMTNGTNNELVVNDSPLYRQLLADGYKPESPVFTSSSIGTVPIYWKYDPIGDRSLYTSSQTEGDSSGFINKGIAFYTCKNDNQKPLYRLVDRTTGVRLLTLSPTERDRATYTYYYRYEQSAFYVSNTGTIPVYRLVSLRNGDRLYTVSASEKDRAVKEYGYRDEGVAFYTQETDKRPVYRLVSLRNGDRLYTVSASEKDRAVKEYGYRDEGVAFYTQ